MAALSPVSSVHIIRFSPTLPTISSPFHHLHPRFLAISTSKLVALKAQPSKKRRPSRLKAVEEETQSQIPQQEQLSTSEQQQEPSTSEQQPVVVPVSPSDTLTMLFQADGTMSETAIPALIKALEETEGVTNLQVQIVEGIASVELKKQTTVQATGVASSLVETIQGSGFKLQTLNLSFDDQEDAAV